LEQRQTSVEALRLLSYGGFDRPVFLGIERGNRFLALDDESQGGALHATGRQTAAHLFPQQRREVEPDEIVECSTRLLRIDQLVGKLARMGDRILDGALGHLVKDNAVYGAGFYEIEVLEHFIHMPGYGFALAVRVRREVYGARLLRRFRDLVD